MAFTIRINVFSTMQIGSGTPLFGDLDSRHIPLEPAEVIETDTVIHLRFRVIK